MAPVVKELGKHPDRIRSVICSVGQHRELLHPVLRLFQIEPDYELNVLQSNQSLSQLTARILTGLDEVVSEVKPDWMLAQGDTTTVLASAIVASYHRIAFGHVEAGLRTYDKQRPFPEEINRRLADLISDVYFAPTETARQALLKEGCPEWNIYVTGNTVIDALNDAMSHAYDWESSPLVALPRDKRMVLVTAHRRESFGRDLREMCLAIRDLAFEFDTVHFVYPVHLNPNVKQHVNEILRGVPNISLFDPLDYLSLLHLMKRSALILTDSGGIQEEAPALKVPVLVMRDTTERPEGIEAGVARLVGTQRCQILLEAGRLLRNPLALAAMANGANPYGNGKAAKRIVSVLLDLQPNCSL